MRLLDITFHNPSQTFRRIFDDTTMEYIHTRLHAFCSTFVPMDTGTLDQTVNITSDYVEYKVPYAHYQYEGDNFNFSKEKHPLASAHWEKAMMQAKGEDFAKDIEDYLKGR